MKKRNIVRKQLQIINRLAKQKNLLIFFKIILLMIFTNLSAQSDIYFEKYSVKDGLSSSVVNSVCQDHYGFLWIATENGLNRFDGYNFKVYKHDPADSTSIPGDNISTVIEDREGNIWVGGFEVLAKYDRKTNRFFKITIEKLYSDPTTILAIMEDSQNRKWFTTDLFGVQLLDEIKGESRIVDKSDTTHSREWTKVNSIIETQSGEIIVADYGQLNWQNQREFTYGLFRYNEISKTFDLINKLPQEKSIKISNILEDDFENIWVSSDSKGELLMFNPHSGLIKNIILSTESIIIKSITKMFKDNDGYLWIGTSSGLIKYNPVLENAQYFLNDKSNHNSISSNQIASIFQDSFGQLWIGTTDGGINKVDLGRQPIHSFKLPQNENKLIPIDAVSCITTSPSDENVVWIGTIGNGLYKFNRNKNEYSIYRYSRTDLKSLRSNMIYSLEWDNTGNLWVGTDTCLCKIDISTNQVTRYLESESELDENPISGNEIISDKTGKLWLATTNGVNIYVPKSGSFKRLPNITNRKYDKQIVDEMINLVKNVKPIKSILRVGNLENLTEEITIEKPTKTLAVCLGEGRVGFDIRTWGDHGWIEDENGKVVWGMNNVENTFSFGGAFKNRLQIQTINFAPGKYKLRYKSDQGYYYGYESHSRRPPLDSLLWGIQLFEIDDQMYSELDEILQKESLRNEAPFEIALSIEFSKVFENVIWIGTNNKGLFKYNFHDDTYEHFQVAADNANPINDITRIVEDNYGIVWFTTPSGLGNLNTSNNQISFITEKDGLPANNVKAILFDKFDDIWVSSIVGLSEIIRDSNEEISSILNFTTQDGLQGYQFSFAAHQSKNGELFFGGNNGFNSFFPGRPNRTPALIAITGFNIAEGTKNNSNSTMDLNNIEAITLPYEQNDLSFEFASIHFANPARNKIYYKLSEINSEWVKDNRRFASFTHLAPGDYTLELKASNGDGIWNDKVKSIAITILSPWYRTNIAYVTYGIIFVGFIFGIDRYQRRRLLFKEKERQKTREAELRAEAAELKSSMIQAENERKSKELEEARKLQLSMLPIELPQLPNLDIAVYMKTATEVGGDYYDFHVSLDGTLTVVLGDATGHGMKAGTMVTAVKGLFNSYSANPDILYSFQEISRCIKQMRLGKLSMCMTMLKINNKKLIMSAAGMPPIMIYKREERSVSEEVIKGMPLGTFDNYPYDIRESKLTAGDAILLMSDGLPELQNDSGEQFGYQRVRNLFENCAELKSEEIIEHLKREGNLWSNENEPDDDITFVVIKVK